MQEHLWIAEVLEDLMEYAENERLFRLKASIRELRFVVASELGISRESFDCKVEDGRIAGKPSVAACRAKKP